MGDNHKIDSTLSWSAVAEEFRKLLDQADMVNSEWVTLKQLNHIMGTSYHSLNDIPRGVLNRMIITLVRVIAIPLYKQENNK